jgi:L-threonylcarbamoyladenylate synthase
LRIAVNSGTIITATEESLVRAAALIQAGELVAFPTETVYGLGADATNPLAVAKIFQAKGRPSHNPLIVHVGDIPQAWSLTNHWSATAELLVSRYWPGPLTIVLPRSERVPDIVTAGGDSVAVRMPKHLVAVRLLRLAGVPIAAPSANRSGQLSPTQAEHVRVSLGDQCPLVLDDGPCPGGLESTVVDLTGPVPRLLRPGLINIQELRAVLGKLELGPEPGSGPLRSPGLLEKHYAPRTRLLLLDSEEALNELQRSQPGIPVYRLPPDPLEAAARLYADLHDWDERGIPALAVLMPQDEPAWQAIRDRLQRAAV